MSNVRPLASPPKLPADTSAHLRALADRVDRGEVTALVIAMVDGGSYEFLMPSPLSKSLELATLLQHRCINKFTE